MNKTCMCDVAELLKTKSRDLLFYRKWKGIQSRTTNPNTPGYKNYGGRGISCDWKTWGEFVRDMYPSYVEHVITHGDLDTSLDRIDNDGNYSKENCRWVTRLEQRGNKRDSILITFNGSTKNIHAWASELGMATGTFEKRFRRGWSLEEIFNRPVQQSNHGES